jgi:hypothetical protein
VKDWIPRDDPSEAVAVVAQEKFDLPPPEKCFIVILQRIELILRFQNDVLQ